MAQSKEKIYDCNGYHVLATSKPKASKAYEGKYGFKPPEIKVTDILVPDGVESPKVFDFYLDSPNIYGCPNCLAATHKIGHGYVCPNNTCFWWYEIIVTTRVRYRSIIIYRLIMKSLAKTIDKVYTRVKKLY